MAGHFVPQLAFPHGEATGVTHAESRMVIPARDVLPLVLY